MTRTSSIRIAAAIFTAATALTSLPLASAANTGRRGAEYFTNAELTTQYGKKVRFYDDVLKDKIVVIEMFYTHCLASCPLETARLAQVQRMLGDRVGKDIFFYSITLDPERDTPELNKAFAEKYNVGPGWLFLTGKKQDVDLISKRLGLYTEIPSDSETRHEATVLIGNEPAGQWILNSAFDNPRFLAVMIGDWLNSWKGGTVAGKTYADAAPVTITEPGQYIFSTHCSACHTIGQGDGIGPDLRGVTQHRDQAWLRHFIAAPTKMVAERDPIATALYAKYKQVNMPNLGLADNEVSALVHYLQTRDASSPAQKATPADKTQFTAETRTAGRP